MTSKLPRCESMRLYVSRSPVFHTCAHHVPLFITGLLTTLASGLQHFVGNAFLRCALSYRTRETAMNIDLNHAVLSAPLGYNLGRISACGFTTHACFNAFRPSLLFRPDCHSFHRSHSLSGLFTNFLLSLFASGCAQVWFSVPRQTHFYNRSTHE